MVYKKTGIAILKGLLVLFFFLVPYAVAALPCDTLFLGQKPAGIWWPSKKVARKDAPVVVWFHGGMSSGNCQKGLVAGGDLSSMAPGYIVVSASACRQDHWVVPTTIALVDEVLDSVAQRRGQIISEVSLVGISDGSLGVIAYSKLGKRKVVSRVLISSYGGLLGAASDLARDPAFKTGRWRFIQGGADRLYPSQETVPWIEGFCRNVGAECDLKFDPQGEHDWSYWQNKRKNWILEFF